MVKNPDLWIRFKIRDTGIGIDQRDIDIIFNPFIQVVRRSDRKAGTGLGLPISRRFVQIMGSDLKVKSEKSKGSTFWFDLPIQVANPPNVVKIESPNRPIGLAPDQPRYRILIVEDHEESRIILTKLLKTVGFKIQEAVNGKEGVEAFLRFRPDLILMDIRMPVMDGLTATKKIKATETGNNTPVIALTAHAFERERIEILAAGCDDFIHKPYDEVDLFAMLIRHLGVTFIYEQVQVKRKPELISTEKVLESGVLAQLPGTMLSELKSAAAELNFKRTIACIEQIRLIDRKVADALAALAGTFKFEEILATVDRVKNNLGRR